MENIFDDIELKIIIMTSDIVKSICPDYINNDKKDFSGKINYYDDSTESNTGVYIIFDNKNISYLGELDKEGKFVLTLDKNNPFIKFVSADGKHSFSFIIKDDIDEETGEE